jgi:hypothetical protein
VVKKDEMPVLLKELHQLEFDYDDGEGIDFEPYSKFISAKDTREWIQSWTGNKTLDGAEYKVFGQDGTGGYAAIWLVYPGKEMLEQPIVFFGSEGELGVVAVSFADYLWLLAAGFGPYEAVQYVGEKRKANAQFTAFAKRVAPKHKSTPAKILARAKAAFPTFEQDIQALCQ